MKNIPKVQKVIINPAGRPSWCQYVHLSTKGCQKKLKREKQHFFMSHVSSGDLNNKSSVLYLFEGKTMLVGGSVCLHHTPLHIILACRLVSPMIEFF